MSNLEREVIAFLLEKNEDLRSRIKELEEREKILRGCVEFYADLDNYTKLHDYKGLHNFEVIGNSELQDRGDKARETLKKLEKLK